MNKYIEEGMRELLKESKTKITVNIDEAWKIIKEKNGWTWKEIIGLGIQAKKENPQWIKRFEDINKRLDRLERRR